ncbi:MAG: hypothetical protein U0X39_10395 [Bacteroidales bacterium]
MKKFLFWFMALLITLLAAYYQRKTGPTYPKRTAIEVNDSSWSLRLVRSLGLDERSEVRLAVQDTSAKATLYYRRFPTNDKFQAVDFSYKTYPVDSKFMNKVFKIYEEKGFYAPIPQQPAAGKIEYYFSVTDSKGTREYFRDEPVVIRFKGTVPGYILGPHILIMFLAMLFSTLAGLMSVFKYKSYKKYAVWTLVLLLIGGMILGPLVQLHAFGELWTGVPFGWDLTDNKTLIAFVFWILAVVMNRKQDRPAFVALAAIVLLLVYSIPHSMFGSQLNYESGSVTQGIIMSFFPG